MISIYKRIAALALCMVMALTAIGCKPEDDTSGISSKTGIITNPSGETGGPSSTDGNGTTDGQPSGSTPGGNSTGKIDSTTSKNTSLTGTKTTAAPTPGPIGVYSLPANPKITKQSTMYYVYVNDMLLKNDSHREKYDQISLITSLQGYVNRTKPSIFIEFESEIDRFWYNYVTADGKIYDGMTVKKISSFEVFVETFLADIKKMGLVAWDKNVPATSNVAATICGADGYLPVRYETDPKSVYQVLTTKYKVPVKMNLAGKFTGKGTIPDTNIKSSGSTKCDAYLWAAEKYLHKTSVDYMAYFLDAATWGDDPDNPYYGDFLNVYLANRDYAIARKAFFFDLSTWGDEKPCDDPDQPMGTDYNTMKKILQMQYNRHNGKKMTQVTGFTPWHIKYTNWKDKGSHAGYETEWKLVEILSAYNCTLDADSAAISSLANASMYMHYPLKSSYKNSKPLVANPKNDKNKKYIYIYMGDYDSAAWVARFVPKMFNDSRRGSIPLAWAFNPNLSQRVPMAFDYFYSKKTPKDFFVSGDSGAGYVMPSFLLEGKRQHSNNPSGMDTWISWNKYFFNKFDLSITGFIINGFTGIPDEVYDGYKQFSPNGAMTSISVNIYEPRVYKGMPLVGHIYSPAKDDICAPNPAGTFAGNIENTANTILSRIKSNTTNTYAFRMVTCTPDFMFELYKKLRSKNPNIEFVDPYTFFEMVKQQ
ncbi:MAG: GxGYxYP family putative glycoside hydrolase [Oscillospiraceae bacterium]|nr:GxGYxYP family putative glycoside hydrolase [Oscillospiraceae bacterium]MDD4413528.1 GxGYxYP family putative glycoside hydrolase [Oscillospiraceae bacterium]